MLAAPAPLSSHRKFIYNCFHGSPSLFQNCGKNSYEELNITYWFYNKKKRPNTTHAESVFKNWPDGNSNNFEGYVEIDFLKVFLSAKKTFLRQPKNTLNDP